MLEWALWTLGMIYLVTEASIFHLPRAWFASKSLLAGQLIYCPACSGFWVGLASWWMWPHDSFPLIPAVAALGLGALWGSWHSNAALVAEAPLRARFGTDWWADDEETESEDG